VTANRTATVIMTATGGPPTRRGGQGLAPLEGARSNEVVRLLPAVAAGEGTLVVLVAFRTVAGTMASTGLKIFAALLSRIPVVPMVALVVVVVAACAALRLLVLTDRLDLVMATADLQWIIVATWTIVLPPVVTAGRISKG